MIRLILRQARPGMTLARAIHNPRSPDLVLLTAGSKLETNIIARLHELGVYDLWVNHPGLEFLDELISPVLTERQQRICEKLKQGFHNQAQRSSTMLPMSEYREVVQGLLNAILSEQQCHFLTTQGDVDDNLIQHSAEVCHLAMLMGVRLEDYIIDQRRRMTARRAKDLVGLGIGCMLHDIGELQMEEKHRESRRQSRDADPAWKDHVTLGYKSVRRQVEPTAANIVLNHHQHFDGSGFPEIGLGVMRRRLAGNGIPIFSRIATAADTFHHLLREDGQMMPTVYALWRIQQTPYCQWIDPVVLKALVAVTPAFAPGVVVKLSDGRDAVAVEHKPETPCQPVVRILEPLVGTLTESSHRSEEIIDLSKQEKLQIASADGFDVSGYLWGFKPAAQAPATRAVA